MSARVYNACLQPVNPPQHGSPPTSFLDQLIDAINPLPNDVFAPSANYDIYSVMLSTLGPWQGLLHRKAVMCEVLRVQPGFESDWDWHCGVDTNNPSSIAHIEQQETGAFQVSADSMHFDQSLPDCVDRLAGAHDVITFINSMKSNHPLAVEYVARLLRFNTTWAGTINKPSQVRAWVRRDAVAEFETFLTLPAAPLVAAASMVATVAAPRMMVAGAARSHPRARKKTARSKSAKHSQRKTAKAGKVKKTTKRKPK
jgi:hypothetical protein